MFRFSRPWRWDRLVDLRRLCAASEFGEATTRFEALLGLRDGQGPAHSSAAGASSAPTVPAEAWESMASNAAAGALMARLGHEARDAALNLMRAYASQGRMDGARLVLCWCAAHMRPLTPSAVDAFLELLTRRANFCHEEVTWTLEVLAAAAATEGRPVRYTQLTYLYLIELHVRLNKDPVALWHDMYAAYEGNAPVVLNTAPAAVPLPTPPLGMLGEGDPAHDHTAEAAPAVRRAFSFANLPAAAEPPLFAAAKLLFHFAMPRSADARYALTVAAVALSAPGGKITRQAMADALILWIASDTVPPEQALWLLYQLELRCAVEKMPISKLMQKAQLAQLMLRCAVAGDSATSDRVMALMERNLFTRTADILALQLWARTQAGEIEGAFDVLEVMARKGFLAHTDAFKRCSLESVGYTMDRHFLMGLADALNTKDRVDRAYYYLEGRHQRSLSVSSYALDVVVLACSKIDDEARAVETVKAYPLLGTQATTATYNCLLLALVGKRKSGSHKAYFDEMVREGIPPNAVTFKFLIRQSVQNDDVLEAMAFLEAVPTFGARVEVEFILPILERAARAGDLDTALRLCKYSLDSDVGIDGVVMHNVIKHLREHGCDTTPLQEMLPLHDQLRSRSKAARRRVRSEVPAVNESDVLAPKS